MRSRRVSRAALALLIASIAGAGYWYSSVYRAREIRLPVVDGAVDLSALGRDWDTVCVIGAYENNRTARTITGVEIDIENRSRSVKYENFTLLVTMTDRHRVRLFDVARHPSDFAKLSSTCWPHGTRFRIEAGAWHDVRVPDGR